MDIPEFIKENYYIDKKIGSGSFGEVWKAINPKNNSIVAIKIEKKKKNSRLEFEYNIYKDLSENSGIPKTYWYGSINNKNILIMDYLGPTLEDLFNFCDKNFCLKTVCMIAIQLISNIKIIHDKGFIHRDIKPDNFLIGTKKKKGIIYFIDFGLSKKFIDNNNEHLDYVKNSSFTGSFRYSSIRNHKGISQSRRDDLESLGYMLIYFLKKKLPWQGLKGSTKSKRLKNIFSVKRNTSLNELCSNIPNELLYYMKYVRLLRYKQAPNYNYLIQLFHNIMSKNNYKYDYIFDWNIIAKKKKLERKDVN